METNPTRAKRAVVTAHSRLELGEKTKPGFLRRKAWVEGRIKRPF
jgi:hypothetical protein